MTGKFSLVLTEEVVANNVTILARVVPWKKSENPLSPRSSAAAYEYTWTETRSDHILWGCAGKRFHIRLKVYVNADAGAASLQFAEITQAFFQPCSQFVNPAAFMAKPLWDWSQILLRVQVKSLAFSPRLSHRYWSEYDCAGNDWELWLQQCRWSHARPEPFIQPHKIFLGVNDRHWKRSLIQWFGLWHRTECALFEENEKLDVRLCKSKSVRYPGFESCTYGAQLPCKVGHGIFRRASTGFCRKVIAVWAAT